MINRNGKVYEDFVGKTGTYNNRPIEITRFDGVTREYQFRDLETNARNWEFAFDILINTLFDDEK